MLGWNRSWCRSTLATTRDCHTATRFQELKAALQEELLGRNAALQALRLYPQTALGLGFFPDVAKVILLKHSGILDEDLASKRWIGDDHVESGNILERGKVCAGNVSPNIRFGAIESLCKRVAELTSPQIRWEQGVGVNMFPLPSLFITMFILAAFTSSGAMSKPK